MHAEGLEEQDSSLGFEGEPSSFVNNVNVISGTFHHSSVGLTIPGQEALALQHFYSSDACFENWMGRVALSTNFPTRIIHTGLKELGAPKHLSAESSQGSFLRYKSKAGSGEKCDRTYYLDPKIIHKGLTNTGSGELSGRTNLKNSWFRIEGVVNRDDEAYADTITAGLGDGTFRKYHRLYKNKETVANLDYEIRPNGDYLFFDYDHNKNLKAIHLFDKDKTEAFGWLKFTYDGDEKKASVSSSNGKKATYSFFRKD